MDRNNSYSPDSQSCDVYTGDSILLFKRKIGPIKSQSSPEESFWSPVLPPVLPIFVGVCPSSEMSEMRPKLNKYSENSNFTVTLRVPVDWKDIRFNVEFSIRIKQMVIKYNIGFVVLIRLKNDGLTIKSGLVEHRLSVWSETEQNNIKYLYWTCWM